MQELIIQNAVYHADQKRLEIVIAMADFNVIETTAVAVDKESGAETSRVTNTEKRLNQAYGKTVYCPDAPGHVHDPIPCAKAHPEYGAVKADLTARITDWRLKTPPVTMTPADRKLE